MTSKNYFVENRDRKTSVMISKGRENYQELQKNTFDFFPNMCGSQPPDQLCKFVYLITACQIFSKYNWFGKQQSVLWKVSLIYKKKTTKQNETNKVLTSVWLMHAVER